LPTIELNENAPIGHTLINLRDTLLLHRDILEHLEQHNNKYHFKFEFIDTKSIASSSSYFLLDSHTGIIQTLKVLDVEHWCNSGDELTIFKCTNNICGPIHFRIKASLASSPSSSISLYVYHIYFDVYIKDLNEHEPEFVDGNQTVQFNVSEEIAPIKLPLGVRVAHDLDCADRFSLISYKIVWPQINTNTNKNKNTIKSEEINVKVVHDAELDLLFLVVQEPFDRELVEFVEFEVIRGKKICKVCKIITDCYESSLFCSFVKRKKHFNVFHVCSS